MKFVWLCTPTFTLYWGFCAASRSQPTSLSLKEIGGSRPKHSDNEPLHQRGPAQASLHPSLSIAGADRSGSASKASGTTQINFLVRPTSHSIAFLQTEDNLIGRGIEALKEWWAGWQEYFQHKAGIEKKKSEMNAGKGHGFMGGGAAGNSPGAYSLARGISVLVASSIPLGALAAGGILWRAPKTTFRIMLAVLLLALIFLGSAPPHLRKSGTTPLVVAIWGLFCIGIYIGAPLAHPDPLSRRSRADIAKESQLDAVWDLFFKACSDRGILELQSGRFSVEEVEGAEPRLLIAIPGLVFLHCALDSIKKGREKMELPGGTTVVVGAQLAEESKVSTGRSPDGVAASSVFARLLSFDEELRHLSPLTEAEVDFVEARLLQVNPEELVDVQREGKVNLVAGALMSAATEVTQIPAFKKRMGGAMQKMVAKPDSQDEKPSITDLHSHQHVIHCPRTGLPLGFM